MTNQQESPTRGHMWSIPCHASTLRPTSSKLRRIHCLPWLAREGWVSPAPHRSVQANYHRASLRRIRNFAPVLGIQVLWQQSNLSRMSHCSAPQRRLKNSCRSSPNHLPTQYATSSQG
jgi:hypothetical protein